MQTEIQATVTKHFLGGTLAALEVTLPKGSGYSVLDLQDALGAMIPADFLWMPGGSATWFTSAAWEAWLQAD